MTSVNLKWLALELEIISKFSHNIVAVVLYPCGVGAAPALPALDTHPLSSNLTRLAKNESLNRHTAELAPDYWVS